MWQSAHDTPERLRESRRQRRALLVVSDGADNHSRYGMSGLRRQLREADVTIYAIGSPNETSSSCARLCQFEASARLANLAEMTGGKAFFPHSYQSLEKTVSHIAVELRRQYSLGYAPSSTSPTGNWRRISARVKTAAKVSVRARAGYFAGRSQHAAPSPN
jgi:Ca-activated chloride channel family protein